MKRNKKLQGNMLVVILIAALVILLMQLISVGRGAGPNVTINIIRSPVHTGIEPSPIPANPDRETKITAHAGIHHSGGGFSKDQYDIWAWAKFENISEAGIQVSLADGDRYWCTQTINAANPEFRCETSTTEFVWDLYLKVEEGKCIPEFTPLVVDHTTSDVQGPSNREWNFDTQTVIYCP